MFAPSARDVRTAPVSGADQSGVGDSEESRAKTSRGHRAGFPQRELEIRRLCARDSTFSAICEDYQDAMSALRYWQSPGHTDLTKSEDYRQLAADLEAEIRATLDGQPRCRPPEEAN